MRKSAKELAREISNFVNGASNSEIKELAELMSHDHPTLQQLTMGLSVEFIKKMSEKVYPDQRNEGSKEMAGAMLAGYQKHLTDKFIGQGMESTAAAKQSEACIQNISGNLPFV